ncbi:methyl-accepting chemotaxis protein [Aminiphilus circumscriptus]|uniref:methyl-accepting chemotaxis protein n=1 Tax=Aminiphilus circumscriptus TaxID=290732 RepID=UPI0004785BA0|nr:methyl-accepting chemotaxis protein [Aminiphilus circumscriptus]
MWLMRTIRGKILVWFVSAVVVLCGALGMVLYRQVNSSVTALADDMAMGIARARADQLGEWLLRMIDVTRGAAEMDIVHTMSWDAMKGDLRLLQERESRFIEMYFVADASGHAPTTVEGLSANLADRPYFKEIMSGARDMAITDPVISRTTNQPIFVIAHAIKDYTGKPVGVLGASLRLDAVSEMMKDIAIGNGGFGWIVDSTGLVMAHPDKEQVMKLNVLESAALGFKDLDTVVRRVMAGEATQGVFTRPDGSEVALFSLPVPHAPKWTLGVAVPVEELHATAHALAKILAGLVGAIVVVFFIISYLLGNSISRPIKNVVALAERARDGDLSFTREDFHVNTRDEMNTMADALAAMIARQRQVVLELQEEAVLSAQRAESLAALSEETVASMEEVKGAIETVASLSESNSAALQQTNAGVEEVASSATTAAQSASEGAEATAVTAGMSEKSVARVEGVIAKIQAVGARTEDSVKSINRVAASVSSITQFVTTIKQIADQTNLLALNAAIEAARAGEAGRGFAVVAEEVRKLAEESNVAAKQVESLIGSLQADTKQSLDITTESGTIMKETVAAAAEAEKELKESLAQIARVNDVMQNIAAASQEQAAAAQEMASGIDQVTKGTLTVVDTIENIRQATESTAKASENVAREAQETATGAERIQKLLSQFSVGGAEAGLVPAPTGAPALPAKGVPRKKA